MMRLFSFSTLITPSIVRFVFYLGVVVSLAGSLLAIGQAMAVMQYSSILGLLALIATPVVALVGIVLSRILAELILIPFMIRDELAWQRQQREVRLAAAAE